jgi:hypothetical protein
MGDISTGDHEPLRRKFAQLPPEHVRWETEPGYEFWAMLTAEREEHTLAQLAQILHISISGARKIVERRIPKTYPWPSDAETEPLEDAWEDAEHARRATGRLSRAAPQFIAVQNHLLSLLERYQLNHLAAAIGTSPRALIRFIPKPSSKPENSNP